MKKQLKKQAIILMGIFILVLNLLPVFPVSAAASPSMAESKTILVGTSFKLKIKNKRPNLTYTWYTDNKNIATVNQKGVVKGLKEGYVTITCCIRDSKDADDEDQLQCYVEVTTTADVKTQTQLNEALKNNTIKTINLMTAKAESFSIPKGSYNAKTVVVNAPKSTVENYGKFKKITLEKAKSFGWKEYVNNNEFEIIGSGVGFTVPSGYKVKSITFTQYHTNVKLTVNGTLEKIVFDGWNAKLLLDGKTKKCIDIIVKEFSSKCSVEIKNKKINANISNQMSELLEVTAPNGTAYIKIGETITLADALNAEIDYVDISEEKPVLQFMTYKEATGMESGIDAYYDVFNSVMQVKMDNAIKMYATASKKEITSYKEIVADKESWIKQVGSGTWHVTIRGEWDKELMGQTLYVVGWNPKGYSQIASFYLDDTYKGSDVLNYELTDDDGDGLNETIRFSADGADFYVLHYTGSTGENASSYTSYLEDGVYTLDKGKNQKYRQKLIKKIRNNKVLEALEVTPAERNGRSTVSHYYIIRADKNGIYLEEYETQEEYEDAWRRWYD